jgi:TPR repeat protein
MSDIFISYASEDRHRAEMLAQILENRGWSIFWDRTIPIGKTWRETIGSELDNARCVIVLWSKTSIKSDWVQDEADDAKHRGVLVPILIENVQPPMGFRNIQAAHLENWDGTEPQAFHRLIADIAAIIGPLKEIENERRHELPTALLSPQAPRSATREPREQLQHVSSEQPKGAALSSTVPWWVIAGLGSLAVLVMVGVWQKAGPPVAPQPAPSITSQPTPPITSQPTPQVRPQDGSAFYSEGVRYYYGRGVTQDYAKAREWYQKAADQGNVEAMYDLGVLYDKGQGVAQDYAKAREWWQKASDGGDPAAMQSLGALYVHGQGVAQDYAKAREWWQKAADGGDPVAMHSLGALYFNGQGVAQDYAKAREWYQKAADQGNAAAMVGLGFLYEKGQEVAQDYAKARDWYQKAADKGDADAKARLSRLPMK